MLSQHHSGPGSLQSRPPPPHPSSRGTKCLHGLQRRGTNEVSYNHIFSISLSVLNTGNWVVVLFLHTSRDLEPVSCITADRLYAWLELSGEGGWGFNPPVYIYRGSFWVKIGFKFQSMGKILNNSTADPRVLLGQFQHWLYVVSLSAYVLRARIKSLKHIACTLQWHLLIFYSYALMTLLWQRTPNSLFCGRPYRTA